MSMRAGEGAAEVAQLARLLQFGDSMLPIGGFAFSSGLESAVKERVVTDAASLLAFARTAVGQAARGDGIAVVCAHRAAVAGDRAELVRIDQLVHARKLSGETRTMTLRVGRKFAQLAAEVAGMPQQQAWYEAIRSGATPGCYPVALAVSFAAQGLGDREAFVVHQYGVASALLSAALRLMRIGHIDTQRMLYEINTDIDTAWRRASAAGLSHMGGFAPMTEILAAVHVRAHVRLFMN